MDALNFAYWLNGFAELTGDTAPTPEQWRSIREHLATVFYKVTPPVPPFTPFSPGSARTPTWHEPPYRVTCTAQPSFPTGEPISHLTVDRRTNRQVGAGDGDTFYA